MPGAGQRVKDTTCYHHTRVSLSQQINSGRVTPYVICISTASNKSRTIPSYPSHLKMKNVFKSFFLKTMKQISFVPTDCCLYNTPGFITHWGHSSLMKGSFRNTNSSSMADHKAGALCSSSAVNRTC